MKEKVKPLIEFNRYIRLKCYKKAADVLRQHRLPNVTITKEQAKKKYKLKEKDFNSLNYKEIDNPYCKSSNSMKLYIIQEIEDKFGAEKIINN